MKSCNLVQIPLVLDVVTEDVTGESVPTRIENISFRVNQCWISLDGWEKDGKTLAEHLTDCHLASLYEMS